jgi:hypothetical protein
MQSLGLVFGGSTVFGHELNLDYFGNCTDGLAFCFFVRASCVEDTEGACAADMLHSCIVGDWKTFGKLSSNHCR